MKKRAKQFLAIALSIVFSTQLIPNNVWEVFAETVTVYVTNPVTVAEVTGADTNYVVSSGNGLTVANGGKVEGTITLQDGGARLKVEAGGTVTGTIDDVYYSEITVDGTVSQLLSDEEGDWYLNSANVGNLKAASINRRCTLTGTTTVKNLSIYMDNLYSGSDGARLYVSDTLEILAEGVAPAHTQLEVTTDTKINNTHGAAMDVICNGVTYPISKPATNATIGDFYKMQVPSEMSLQETAGYTTPSTVSLVVKNNGLEDVLLQEPSSDEGLTKFAVSIQGEALGNSDIYSIPGEASENPNYYSIPAGASITLNVTPVTGLAVGSYTETMELPIYSSKKSIVSESNLKVETVSCDLKLEVNRKQGEGTIQTVNSYYGGTYEVTPGSSTNGTEHVTIEYKEKGAADSTYTKVKPTQVGEYEVRATFAQTEIYTEAVAKGAFQITYLPAPEQAYTFQGTKGENGYLTGDVAVVPAEGYRIAAQLDGDYVSSLKYTEDIKTVYLMKSATGEKTAGIVLDASGVKIDTQVPSITGAGNGDTLYKDTVSLTVYDENLSRVTVNGKAVEIKNGRAVLNLTSDGGATDYEIITKDEAGHEKKITVTVAAPWMELGVVPSGSSVRLTANQAYTFGDGIWQVEGDETDYTGGIQFYVGSDGAYVFKKQ